MQPTNNAAGMFRQSPGEPVQRDNGLVEKMISHAKVTPVVSVDLEQDQEFRSLIAHVLKPGQKLAEFVAAVGLNKQTIKAQCMSAEDIRRFCDQVEQNAVEDANAPSQRNWQPKPIPKHFVID